MPLDSDGLARKARIQEYLCWAHLPQMTFGTYPQTPYICSIYGTCIPNLYQILHHPYSKLLSTLIAIRNS